MPSMEDRLLEARRAFARGLPAALKSAVEFYDIDKYNGAAILQDNILFGRLVYGQAQAAARIGKLIAEVLDELKLRGAVLRIGLEYQVGIAGKRLPARPAPEARPGAGAAEAAALSDRQRGGLADRYGRPGADPGQLLKASEGRTVMWVLRHPRDAEAFKRLIVMKDGRIAEQGPPKELLARKAKVAEGMAAQ